MPKRKRREPDTPRPNPALTPPRTATGRDSSKGAQEADLGMPTGIVRWLVSCLIALHFTGLGIALSANLAQSFLHGEVLVWLAPVHVTTGQDYIMLPLELTQASDMDAPVVIEVMRAQEQAWKQLGFPKGELTVDASHASRWPNLARLLYWISQQQPDSEVLPEFALRAIRSSSQAADGEASDGNPIAAIRLVQPHVVSYDEDLAIANGRAAFFADAMQSNVIYAARIVRDVDGRIAGLVPEQDPSLTSKPTSASKSTAVGSTPDVSETNAEELP